MAGEKRAAPAMHLGEGKLCVCSIQPSPLVGIEGKGRAGTTLANQGKAEAKLPESEVQGCSQIMECPECAPGHSMSNLGICPSLPDAGVAGTLGRCQENKV